MGLPALLLAGQAWQARRNPARLVAVTGVAGRLLTFGVFLVLYTTTWYAPPIDFVSDAALLFSNWLLRRDDQVGCVVFDPVDTLERRRRSSG